MAVFPIMEGMVWLNLGSSNNEMSHKNVIPNWQNNIWILYKISIALLVFLLILFVGCQKNDLTVAGELSPEVPAMAEA